jgi:RNA polymerase sigma-70 factor (ECF subfamily)
VTAPSNDDTKRGRNARPVRTATGSENGSATSVVDGVPNPALANGTSAGDDSIEALTATDDQTVDEVDDTGVDEGEEIETREGEESAPARATSNGGGSQHSTSAFSKVTPPSGRPFLEVLQLAKEGDLKAFEEIFQIYHRRIYNAVYGMLGDPDDAQDVTQDVFMRLHDALPTLRADEAFSTYLYRIALNLCRDRARRKKRVRFQSIDTPRTDEEGSSEPMDFPDLGRLPEDQITNDELQRRVREAVGTLSNDHKSVIVMHHFQGMEVNDIAQILKVPTGTVKSRLARGRDQLHRKLRSYLKPR